MINNAAQQAKSGLKTFILVFSFSLIIFGSLYYVILDSSAKSVSIEENYNSLTYAGDVSGDMPRDDYLVQAATQEELQNPFEQLNSQDAKAQLPSVLAGTTQTTQSTPVPETGTVSITFGLLVSVSLFGFFSYMIFINPRKYALNKHARKILDDLD